MAAALQKFFSCLLLLPLIASLPIDDYINIDDGAFSWNATDDVYNGTLRGGNWSAVGLNVSTQFWQAGAWVHNNADYPSTSGLVWHKVLFVIPEIMNPDREGQAIVYITGGSNGNKVTINDLGFGDEDLSLAAELAVRTGTYVTIIYNNPNEPIRFLEEEGQPSRTESAIDAYTWKQYMDAYDNMTSHDDDDPAYNELGYGLMLFQQTKSADRVMTAIEQFTAQDNNNYNSVFEWVVVGASKRGWTTWMTGIYDATRPQGSRVRGIMPVVFDDLNFQQNLHHHFQAYGGWSFAFEDYWAIGDMARLDTDAFASLSNLVDPYAYKDRLNINKLIINAGGDEFFLPDDWRYFIGTEPFVPNDLTNSNAYYIMAPNTEHSYIFGLGEIVPIMSAWSTLVFNNALNESPNFSWNINYGNYETNTNASITVIVNQNSNYDSLTVTLWVATTCEFHAPRRDFRMENIDVQLEAFDGQCGCGPLGNESQVINNGENCLNFQAHYVPQVLRPMDPLSTSPPIYQAEVELPPYDTENQRYKSFFIDVTFHGVDLNGQSSETTTVTAGNKKQQLRTSVLKENSDGGLGTWPVSHTGDLEYTTQVLVVPDYFPYKDCSGNNCGGTLT